MFRALTNLAEAAFDSLRVRHPPHIGEMTQIADIVNGAVFNPSTLQSDRAQNTAAISALDSSKQDIIGDGDLTIARTANLQSALNDKATTAALSSGLAGKQDLIDDGDLSIAKTVGLQAALDSKAATAAVNIDLTGTQDTIGNGDFGIARTSGLHECVFLLKDAPSRALRIIIMKCF